VFYSIFCYYAHTISKEWEVWIEIQACTDKRVLPGSIAQESDLQEGDLILSINGQKISDIFDYRFLIADENLVLEVQKKNGEIWEIEIEKTNMRIWVLSLKI